MGNDGKFDLERRWGGDYEVSLTDDVRVNIGQAIYHENGFRAIPWLLPKYERALQLKPLDAWLLYRYVGHSWEWGKPVALSVRKMKLEADVSRDTILKAQRRLEQLGYLRRLSYAQGDTVSYDVKGLFIALALCIAVDPTTERAESGEKTISVEQAQAFIEEHKLPYRIDFYAIERLTRRKGNYLEWA